MLAPAHDRPDAAMGALSIATDYRAIERGVKKKMNLKNAKKTVLKKKKKLTPPPTTEKKSDFDRTCFCQTGIFFCILSFSGGKPVYFRLFHIT